MKHRDMTALGERLKALRGPRPLVEIVAACNAHPLCPTSYHMTEGMLRSYEDGRAEPGTLAFSLLARVYGVPFSDLSMTGLPSGGEL